MILCRERFMKETVEYKEYGWFLVESEDGKPLFTVKGSSLQDAAQRCLNQQPQLLIPPTPSIFLLTPLRNPRGDIWENPKPEDKRHKFQVLDGQVKGVAE
jgi:hypothetical protein